MDRRELFTSFSKPFKKDGELEHIIRPPYYNDEDNFSKCLNCKDKACIDSCEENIIILCDDGSVKLDFSVSGCTYCDDCAIACREDVLRVEYKQNIQGSIKIDMLKCMSWNKTMCFSCKDPCLEDAIKFLGMFRPEIDLSQCTMCGFCVKYCPTEAISIIFNKFNKKEEINV